MENRLVTGDKLKEDGFEVSIRPKTIDEYIGQKDIKENIKIFMEAAKMRGQYFLLWKREMFYLLMKYIVFQGLLKKFFILLWKILR